MKYSILVCDPPWQYNNKKTGGSLKSGSGQHYPTMSNYDIKHTVINYLYHNQLMEKDSLCFLWTTNSFMRDAIDIMNCWGYKEKTIITWVKRNYGLGAWFRGKTEHCLFGVKGNIKALRINLPNVIISEKTLIHSSKPTQFYNYVNNCAMELIDKQGKQEANILELFARKQMECKNPWYDGIKWTCIGNELTGEMI